MTQSEIRRIFWGDERKPGTGRTTKIHRDRTKIVRQILEGLQSRADTDDFYRTLQYERRHGLRGQNE